MHLTALHGAAETIIALSGKLDDAAVDEIRPEFEQLAVEGRKRVYVDLHGVSYIDAAAVGALAFLFKRLVTRGRKLVLAGATGQPRRLLELLHIDRVVESSPGVPVSALPTFGGRPAGTRTGISLLLPVGPAGSRGRSAPTGVGRAASLRLAPSPDVGRSTGGYGVGMVSSGSVR